VIGRRLKIITCEKRTPALDFCDDGRMDSYTERLSRRLNRNEDGFSLPELLIVMLIIGILLTLGIGAYLRAQRNAENTQVRDKVNTAYKTVLNCKTENDGFFGSYDDINGAYCLDSADPDGAVVNNNIQLNQIVPGSGETCWNENAETNTAAAQGMAESPAYDSTAGTGGDRLVNVGICTFADVDANGAATDVDADDSQYIRLSAHRNGKAYYFVEDTGGFAACQAPVGDNGKATEQLRCQS
jgi:prepilin-type N-terminal cleavage/methylation domain-containing protein